MIKTLYLLLMLLITTISLAQITVGVTDGNSVIPLQTVGLPSINTPFVDAAFNNTTIRRITNYMDTGQWGAHVYSQLQVFSPDNSHVIVIENGFYVVKNRTSLATVLALNTVTVAGNLDVNAPRWHPRLANTIIAYDSNADTTLRIVTIDVLTGSATVIFTFPGLYERIRSNQSFDELSHDGKWMAGMASTSDGDQIIFSIDLENSVLAAQLRLSDLFVLNANANFEPDWVGISPLGNFLTVQWVPANPNQRLNGMELFNVQSGSFVQQLNPFHDHGDFGLDEGGNEVFISTILVSPEDNNLPAIVSYGLPLRINDPQLILTVPWETVWHISCQGPRGKCVVSSGTTGLNFNNEIFELYFDGSVRRLTHHRSSHCGYWVQPRASISKNGQFIVFDSDFFADSGINSCNTQGGLGGGDVFVIEMPMNNSAEIIFNSGFEN
jgi:hypothetical protein